MKHYLMFYDDYALGYFERIVIYNVTDGTSDILNLERVGSRWFKDSHILDKHSLKGLEKYWKDSDIGTFLLIGEWHE